MTRMTIMTGMHMQHVTKANRAGIARGARTAGVLALLALLLAGCGGDKPTGPKTLTEEEQRYLSEENLWRMQRQERLTRPDGWTSLIGLHWLSLKSHYVGSSADSGIRLMLGPPTLGVVTRNDDQVFFSPASREGITVDGQPISGRVALKDDRDGAPSVIGFDQGKGLMTLIWRGGRHALRVKHADAESRTKFAGLEYWPADRNWRVTAKYVANPPGKTLPIATIIGTTEDTPNPGALEFQRDGKTYRIEALDQGEATLSLIIADRTSGHDSYGAGRYIDVPKPDAKGEVVIDFNRAYNPPCAFTPFATCPLPPNENRLDLAITAGEKRYGGRPH